MAANKTSIVNPETITILGIKPREIHDLNQTLRYFLANIHASKDPEEMNRLVYFMFDNVGTHVVAKDIKNKVAFEFDDDIKISDITAGESYPVETHTYNCGEIDYYAVQIIK